MVAGDIREDAVRPLLDEFGADRVALATGDVRLEATGDALVAAGVAAFGRVDSVVANAGIGFYGGLLDVDADQIALMIDVNLKGTIWLARAAVRQFRVQGDGGDIVVIGSVAGLLIGGGKEAVYAATKGAQINLGTAMDRELRGGGHPHDRRRAGGRQHPVRGGRRPLRRRRPGPGPVHGARRHRRRGHLHPVPATPDAHRAVDDVEPGRAALTGCRRVSGPHPGPPTVLPCGAGPAGGAQR